jgi:hypothetical protein
MNYWAGSESTEDDLQELHPGICLLTNECEGLEPMHSESCDFHSLFPLHVNRKVNCYTESEALETVSWHMFAIKSF